MWFLFRLGQFKTGKWHRLVSIARLIASQQSRLGHYLRQTVLLSVTDTDYSRSSGTSAGDRYIHKLRVGYVPYYIGYFYRT